MATKQKQNSENKAEKISKRIRRFTSRARRTINVDIWQTEYLGRKSPLAKTYLGLRILTLTWQGLRRNKIPVQAAALTFYSLIGLGPLIALGIMVSSFILDQTPPSGTEAQLEPSSRAVEVITSAITFAAPQLTLGNDAADLDSTELAPEMMALINNFIEAAQSGAVGVVGSLMLFVIGLQVLSSIEGSFNSLWGVERGRKLGERIVTYWTFITLSAVFGAAAITLITLSSFESVAAQLPFGDHFLAIFLVVSPFIVFLLLVTLLALFFRFIPNTTVNWKPALIGAALVVLMLYLYNQLSFLYVQRVIDTRSLYGSVGILVVLMLGLFVFWLLILLGGQVTYAVQNADFLTNESAWQRTSERSREIVSLAVLLIVAQRFAAGRPPIRANELHKLLRVPSHIMNSSIHRLCDIGYLVPVEGKTIEEERDHAFQPGRPLESITLGKFKHDFDCYGNNEGADLVAKHTPALQTYLSEVLSLKNCPSADIRISELIPETTAES